MQRSLDLNGTWKLSFVEGAFLNDSRHFTQAVFDGKPTIDATVPAPIQQVLVEKGWLSDPNVGLNSLQHRWVEEAFWVYRRTFAAPAEAAAMPARLIFERLDYEAVVWLNGEEVGRHANAHRPAVFDVTGKVKAGENLLVVRVESGMLSGLNKPRHYARDTDTATRLTNRPWHRHPQYQGGWDWHPHLVGVGILGNVRLEWQDAPRVAQVSVYAVPGPRLQRARFTARVFAEGVSDEAVSGTLSLRIVETGDAARVPVTLRRGPATLTATVEIERPRVWWPRGQGEPFLYTVEVGLETATATQTFTRRTGVRRVEMDQSPHPETGRFCTLRINDVPVFCKGGNWVPADIFYSAVPAARLHALVDLAVGANFNLLRVWGGGAYVDHTLADYCDEKGILLWHDFAFACSKYPGDDPEFSREVRAEGEYVVRELAHHASLVVWCGNNEIETADWGWGYDAWGPTHPHYSLFHHDLGKIVGENDPATLYWVSSPWSPDFKDPNDPTTGDQHPWGVSLADPGAPDWWRYRQHVDRFPNEGGVLGMSTLATLRQFLPEGERRLLSPAWQHHDNPFALFAHQPGGLGRSYEAVQLWLGRDPLAMDWERYAVASGILQAEGLSEYILNYRRRMFSSASAIFWMFNDSWPVTHGWTIVDYYLRRKLAYHPVRRAFQPVTVVVAEEGDSVKVYGVNDSPFAWIGEVRYGLFTMSGERPLDRRDEADIPARTSIQLASWPKAEWVSRGTRRCGAFAVLAQERRPVAQHRLLVERFGNLEFAPDPRIQSTLKDGVLTLTASAFAWGVCLDVEGDRPLADNCFDLLPGIPYSLPWDATRLGEPRIVHVASRDSVRAGPP